ncbi:MAG: hypothetical protein ACLTOJ_03120 [[Clostridium] symbiosum]
MKKNKITDNSGGNSALCINDIDRLRRRRESGGHRGGAQQFSKAPGTVVRRC